MTHAEMEIDIILHRERNQTSTFDLGLALRILSSEAGFGP